MKIAKPVSVEPPSHKDNGDVWRDEYFDEDLRREIKNLSGKGVPVSMRGGKLRYRDKAEGVQFDSVIADLGPINQWRPHWVCDAFLIQVWIENFLMAVSLNDVDELVQ